MAELLRLLLLAFAAWVIWRALKPRAAARRARTATTSAMMLPCAHCGTYIPEDEAITGPDGAYCSAQHARAGGRRRGNPR